MRFFVLLQFSYDLILNPIRKYNILLTLRELMDYYGFNVENLSDFR